MRAITSSLLGLAFVFGLAASGCAAEEASSDGGEGAQAQVAASQPIGATNGAALVLDSVWKVTTIQSPDETSIHLYELGGGDPAINGTYLQLSIGEMVWELPSNILAVKSAKALRAGTIEIVGEQQAVDTEDGNPKTMPWKSTVTYELKNGTLSTTISVDTNGTPETISAKTDTAAKFLSSVYAVTSAESESLHARVFESGGGDPAMNGAHLYLALMNYPEVSVFPLGLDVNRVSKVEVDGKTRKVTIVGIEDTMDGSGTITGKAFRKTFSVTEIEGVPSSVQLTP